MKESQPSGIVLLVSAAYRLLRNGKDRRSARQALVSIAKGELMDLPADARYRMAIDPGAEVKSKRRAARG
jgi:hypothetical protein